MGSAEPGRAGLASAAANTSRELGGVLGVASLGALTTAVFTRAFLAHLTGAGIPASSGGGAAEAAAPPGAVAAANLTSERRDAGRAARGGGTFGPTGQIPPGVFSKCLGRAPGTTIGRCCDGPQEGAGAGGKLRRADRGAGRQA